MYNGLAQKIKKRDPAGSKWRREGQKRLDDKDERDKDGGVDFFVLREQA